MKEEEEEEEEEERGGRGEGRGGSLAGYSGQFCVTGKTGNQLHAFGLE